MFPRIPLSALLLRIPLRVGLAWLWLGTGLVHGEYRDDSGYNQLKAELGAAFPTGAGVGVSQTEAPADAAFSYLPDRTSTEFTGKIINASSGTAGVSGHASTVATLYYGSFSSMAPGVTSINVYEANSWITNFVGWNTTNEPAFEGQAVENHSWIGSLDNGGPKDVDALRRFDYVLQRGDVLAAVGVNNGSGNPVPSLLANAYNAISVGLPSGNHSTGTSTVDGLGRVKPEIVAATPYDATSFSTPTVASAAAMLRQPASAAARHSVTMKAMLMAGAIKTPFPTWNRTTTRPLDAHFGAGQLNVFNSYHILSAGVQPASTTVSVKPRGWHYATIGSAANLYFFDIPAGDTASRFSAVLTWNRVIANTLPNPLFQNPPPWGSPSSTLANLSLRIYSATGFVKGALVDESVSTVDNVEHLYEPNLPPGRYALEVTKAAADATTTYGLAWYSLPTVSVAATTATTMESGGAPGVFTITRGGELASPLTIHFAISGTATPGADYAALPTSVTIPANQSTATFSVTPIPDALAENTETVTLTLTPDFAYAFDGTGSAIVGICDKPMDVWRFNHFTPAELANSAISGDLADPDGDGIANLLEYALNLDPKIAGTAGLPVVDASSGTPTLAYTKPAGITDITYAVEVSTDLATWNSGPLFTATPVVVDGGATQTITVSALASKSAAPQQFMRLRITRQ